MRKNIYLHIGMPKTGTSSLQVFLAQNAHQLQQSNYSYPELHSFQAAKKGKITSGNMGLISRSLLPTFHADHPEEIDSEQELESLRQYILSAECQNIVLSSEFLSVVPELGLQRLSDKLADFNTNIIVYLRPQELFIQSVYAQRVKRHNETESATDFVEKRLKNDSVLNYYAMLNRFSDVFGKQSLIVRIFEEGRLFNNNLQEDFLDAIGIENKNGFNINKKWVNKTPGKNTIHLSRLANKILPPSLSSNIINGLTTMNVDRLLGERDIISHDLQQKIIMRFQESNIKLAKEYLGQDDEPLFISQVKRK